MLNKLLYMLRLVLVLSKVKITVAVSLTIITGYVLANGSFDAGFIPVTIGIFLLACGSSVINHLQELSIDSRMPRTSKRPLPSRDVKPLFAFILAGVEIAVGSFILFYWVNLSAFVLGWIAIVWYNLVYTNLKKVTAHAVIPGSLIGAIPPLAGWVASGASLNDVRAWSMALFFFVWQVPHFYLLVIRYGHQYEKAGLPALTSYYNSFLLKMMIFLWIVTTSFSALLLYYFHVVRSTTAGISIAIASLALIILFFVPLINKMHDFHPFKYFMRINYYVLMIIVLMNLDHVFLRHLL